MILIRKLSTKLYLKLLWLTYAYPFLFAHRPLCNEFREGVIKFGKINLCRGCLALYLGVTVGILSYSFLPHLVAYNKIILVFAYVTILIFSSPSFYQVFPRLLKDALRFFLGATTIICLGLSFSLHLIFGIIFLTGLILLKKLFANLRRQLKSNVCDKCMELREDKICTGFRLYADQFRKFEEKAIRKYKLIP